MYNTHVSRVITSAISNTPIETLPARARASLRECNISEYYQIWHQHVYTLLYLYLHIYLYYRPFTKYSKYQRWNVGREAGREGTGAMGSDPCAPWSISMSLSPSLSLCVYIYIHTCISPIAISISLSLYLSLYIYTYIQIHIHIHIWYLSLSLSVYIYIYTYVGSDPSEPWRTGCSRLMPGRTLGSWPEDRSGTTSIV